MTTHEHLAQAAQHADDARDDQPAAHTTQVPLSRLHEVIDQHTGEIIAAPHQETLPHVELPAPSRRYRLQLTIVTETYVEATDEERAAVIGLEHIDRAEGTIVRRQVAVTYMPLKGL